MAGPTRICALGDLLLDVVVQLGGPIAPHTDTYGRTRVGAGGQAANVAAWVAALGGRGRFVGKRADDPAGRLLAGEVERRGVELAGPVERSGTGTVVSLATPDGRRAMLSDRGVGTSFAPAELDTAWLEGCDHLHLPGYSLLRPPLSETALAACALVSSVSVDVSSTAAVTEAGVQAFRDLLDRVRPSIVFATEAEAELVGPFAAETVVVKRGERGCLVRRGGDEREYPALAAVLADATGAGDAFAAGFLLAGPELGLEAAARCVSQLGAMP
ncbi:MAG: carbohydrate kinase family protein [Actinobacteria bacterium]|nr:carbohydrate kinase family protein [Actinomycetota bacterium]